MVQISTAFLVAALSIVPAFAAPTAVTPEQVSGRDAEEIEVREPRFRAALSRAGRVMGHVGTAVGIGAAVAPLVTGRESEEDDLEARQPLLPPQPPRRRCGTKPRSIRRTRPGPILARARDFDLEVRDPRFRAALSRAGRVMGHVGTAVGIGAAVAPLVTGREFEEYDLEVRDPRFRAALSRAGRVMGHVGTAVGIGAAVAPLVTGREFEEFDLDTREPQGRRGGRRGGRKGGRKGGRRGGRGGRKHGGGPGAAGEPGGAAPEAAPAEAREYVSIEELD